MRLFLRSLLLTFFAVTLANAGAFSQTATINTDQLDYPPGSTVIITGTGWQPGETVTLQVLHEGETGDNAISGAHAPFTAVADASGNVSSTWVVPLDEDELGATLLLTADGVISGRHAETTFKDANIVFTATGLPPNSSCTVTVTYWTVPPKNGQSQQVTTLPQLISVNNGGSASSIPIAANPGTTITWTYSDASGFIYTSSSYNNGTPVNESTGFIVVGNQTGVSSVIGHYTECTAPLINNALLNQNTTYGLGPVSFSVNATGTSLNYQWQVLTTSVGAIWTDIPSATFSSYTVTTATVAMSGYQYRVIVSGCSSVTSNAATLTVNKANLSITANNETKIYGDVVTFAGSEFTATGLVNGDAINSVTLASTGAAATATVTTPGPTYPIVASAAVGTGLGNYNIAYANGTLTVGVKSITVTASDRTKTYGDAVVFTGTEFSIPAGAIVNGDAINSVTLASTGAAATATVTTPGPTYPIVASAAVGTGLGNYNIAYANGTLTVGVKSITVT
ncbi:hypothetical protein EFY79_09410, partial [Hanamia caeni]